MLVGKIKAGLKDDSIIEIIFVHKWQYTITLTTKKTTETVVQSIIISISMDKK